MRHLSGCVGGGKMVLRINLWDRPPGPETAALVGRLRGTSEDRRCRGDVVSVREVVREVGRKLVRVETVAEGRIGWVREIFIGPRFPRRDCRDRFIDPPAVERCLDPGR